MLKRPITYTDYNNVKRTEEFYFALNKSELIQLQLSSGKEGYAEALQELVNRQNGEEIVETFKKIILMAYGEKSEDGRHFRKKDDNGRRLSDDFEQSAAFDELFTELATVTQSAIDFVNGIAPSDLNEDKRFQPQDHKQKQETVKGTVVADLPEVDPSVSESLQEPTAAPEAKPLSEYTPAELEAHLASLKATENGG